MTAPVSASTSAILPASAGSYASTLYFNDACIKQNQQALEFCRSAFGAIAGTAAGILGLTSFAGFAFYVVASAWMSLVMLGVYGGRAGVARYFKGVAPVVVGGIADNLLSFVLFWT